MLLLLRPFWNQLLKWNWILLLKCLTTNKLYPHFLFSAQRYEHELYISNGFWEVSMKAIFSRFCTKNMFNKMLEFCPFWTKPPTLFKRRFTSKNLHLFRNLVMQNWALCLNFFATNAQAWSKNTQFWGKCLICEFGILLFVSKFLKLSQARSQSWNQDLIFHPTIWKQTENGSREIFKMAIWNFVFLDQTAHTSPNPYCPLSNDAKTNAIFPAAHILTVSEVAYRKKLAFRLTRRRIPFAAFLRLRLPKQSASVPVQILSFFRWTPYAHIVCNINCSCSQRRFNSEACNPKIS